MRIAPTNISNYLSTSGLLLVLALAGGACQADATEAPDSGLGFDDAGVEVDAATAAIDASLADAGDPSALPYATEIVSFTPGSGAGFGQEDLPQVVLGPPTGHGTGQASLQVLSLGVGGEIILGFGEKTLINGPGPDLVVFENPFWVGGDSSNPFAELGEVAVSNDGVTWHPWLCDPDGDGAGHYPDCAGWSPSLEYDAFALVPIDPSLSGGDSFDLEKLGLSEARFVRIRDLATAGSAPSAGFDLDAVGLVHFSEQ